MPDNTVDPGVGWRLRAIGETVNLETDFHWANGAGPWKPIFAHHRITEVQLYHVAIKTPIAVPAPKPRSIPLCLALEFLMATCRYNGQGYFVYVPGMKTIRGGTLVELKHKLSDEILKTLEDRRKCSAS